MSKYTDWGEARQTVIAEAAHLGLPAHMLEMLAKMEEEGPMNPTGGDRPT